MKWPVRPKDEERDGGTMGRNEWDGDRHKGQTQAQGTRNKDTHKKPNLFQRTHAQRPAPNEREKDQKRSLLVFFNPKIPWPAEASQEQST